MNTYDIDQFLVCHDSIPTGLLAGDVGKSERWVKARITRLKNCGAWDIIKNKQAAQNAFNAGYFAALKQEHFIEVDQLSISRAVKALSAVDAEKVSW